MELVSHSREPPNPKLEASKPKSWNLETILIGRIAEKPGSTAHKAVSDIVNMRGAQDLHPEPYLYLEAAEP